MSNPSPSDEEPTRWQKSESKFTGKRYSEYYDPCQDVADRSIKCMRRNGGDKTMCQDYFDAYKACKKEWMEEMQRQKAERKRKNSWFSSSN